MHPPPRSGYPFPSSSGRLRLHRNLLQPAAAPQRSGLSITCGLRKPKPLNNSWPYPNTVRETETSSSPTGLWFLHLFPRCSCLAILGFEAESLLDSFLRIG